MLVSYPEDLSLRDARRLYFDANQFGEDGGYSAKWVDFKLGKIPFPIPNAPGRVRAVRFHDLHHVLTAYETSTVGEFEISAWEIAAGCKGFGAAWLLNLSGMVGGLLVAPGRVFRAFVRGRRSRTLYGETFEPLLDLTVREGRARYLPPEPAPKARASDVALFVVASIAGTVVALAMMAIVLPLVPIGLIAVASFKRRRAREGSIGTS